GVQYMTRNCAHHCLTVSLKDKQRGAIAFQRPLYSLFPPSTYSVLRLAIDLIPRHKKIVQIHFLIRLAFYSKVEKLGYSRTESYITKCVWVSSADSRSIDILQRNSETGECLNDVSNYFSFECGTFSFSFSALFLFLRHI